MAESLARIVTDELACGLFERGAKLQVGRSEYRFDQGLAHSAAATGDRDRKPLHVYQPHFSQRRPKKPFSSEPAAGFESPLLAALSFCKVAVR
jgi:hypothetical protein